MYLDRSHLSESNANLANISICTVDNLQFLIKLCNVPIVIIPKTDIYVYIGKKLESFQVEIKIKIGTVVYK